MFNVYERLDNENGHFISCSSYVEFVQTSSIGELVTVRVNIELGGRGMKMLFPWCKIKDFVDNIAKHRKKKSVPEYFGHR